ncbi:winged helix-turn-helix domain-containing protein [Thermoplasma sp.]|uniref:winged helix-turn-helix domain-containing protein n=1 Tax=Thermoplasma sp. TaxID=1973142 RepID=UPI00127A2665|nr:winged helix-turn-helix domain-containing protein [Thermoplasma sp.]KAA8922629.1 MAG: winged helix-turn-helix transcriptional regulator [Thermoplasma sp.]
MDGSAKNIDLLLKNFSNRTRLMIITLIIENGPMTVTQLSRTIKTSRSNLYQIIKDMVSDGVVIQVKTETNRNYVEKYYYINENMFASVKSEDLKKALIGMDDESLRNLIISFLTTSSAIMSIAAEQIAMAGPEEIKRYREEINSDLMIMFFSSLSRETMARYSEMHMNFMKRIEESTERSTEDHFLYVIGFPSFAGPTMLSRIRRKDGDNGNDNERGDDRS